MPDEAIVTPYVQVAAFCQTAIREGQGSLSLIRLITRFPVVGLTKEMQPTPISLTLAVILKSGNMQGSYTLTVRPVTPTEEVLPPLNVPILFEGSDRGVALVRQIALVAKEPGLYWFDVLVEGTLLTRIPLRILYQQGQQIGLPPDQSS
jgi:Family of unknown function (DUF6941)